MSEYRRIISTRPRWTMHGCYRPTLVRDVINKSGALHRWYNHVLGLGSSGSRHRTEMGKTPGYIRDSLSTRITVLRDYIAPRFKTGVRAGWLRGLTQVSRGHTLS
ncbi:hypothetical protein RRG08_037066 [Elysia crispata]|uniref:Uncharacterized protein n=1 Tax=Elysia crispata TaxID=231223 RepID=A0AAE0ZW86_9GAST|nr:hypothetical protein RRG08_037066 [Elysia crispata]